MDEKGKPNTPDADVPPPAAPKENTILKVELEFSLPQQRLMIRSQAATIMIEGALMDAVQEVVGGSPGGALPADGIVRVNIEHDLATGATGIAAQAPRVVLLGVLQHALGAVTRNQVMQGMQVEREDMKKRIVALEEKLLPPKIILPIGANA